jgi:hypothetical protein
MFYSNHRSELRQQFFSAYNRYQSGIPLSPLERQIVAVILAHPEYIALFENPDVYLDKDYLPEMGETNPFLHMSAHLSIKEQVATNRPKGIQKVFKQLIKKNQCESTVEHLMMECLMELLHYAQTSQQLADEASYLKKLKQLLKK